MILVDSNVIINFWKKPDPKLREIFLTEEVAVCGVTYSEQLYGAKNEKDIETIIDALSDFCYVEIGDIWEELGKILFRLKKKRITVPFQDALLCSVALKYNLPIWTDDKHFK